MRVCFISPAADSLFFPQIAAHHGGSETQFYRLACELEKRDDFEVHFVVNGPANKTKQICDGVDVHFHTFVAGLKPKIPFQKLLAHIDADIYLQRGIGSTTKEVAFFCLWRRRRFLYWVAHDYDVNPLLNSSGLHINRGKLFEWAMKKADILIAQTQYQAGKLQRNFNREAIVIPSSYPRRNASDQERKHILWAGRFIGTKQPELFIELAERLPDEQFLMIALIASAESRKLFQASEDRLGDCANIEFIAGVPSEKMPGFYDRAKLFVSTSLTEGYPNTFIEAMWAGVPIASLSFDPDNILKKHQLGVAPTENIDEFSTKIRCLLDDTDRWEHCRNNVYAYAQTHHDLVSNVDRLAEVLYSRSGVLKDKG